MTVDLPALDMGQVLSWAAWVVRDLTVVWSLAMAGIAALTLPVSRLARGRARPDRRAVDSGLLAWLLGAAACLAGPEAGLFLSRPLAVGLLLLSTALWGLTLLLSCVGHITDRS